MQVIVENPNTIVIDVDQGRAGRGIQNITYTEVSGQYFLIVTYTDGTTETLGPLVVTGGAAFLLGGNTGSIPYQSAPNTTVFLPIGAQNQVVVAGATAPQYTSALTGLTINNSPIGNVTKSTGGFTDVTADSVQFNTAATEANAVGKVYWDAAQGTLDLGLLGGNVISRIGQSLVAYVTNAEAVTITKGQVVYLFGAQGDRATVKLAYNTSDATSAKTFGVVAENIPANGTGFVMCQGVLEGLNLGAFTAGDTLYLGATPGSLTATKPHAPNHLVYVGLVERANPGNGQLYVKVQNGYELDEIHDVQIVNPQNGQTILYDASTSLWKNANLTAGTGISVTNGAASVTIGNTGVLSFSGGTTGLTPATSTTGAVTLGGTLAVASGGTGATTAGGALTNLGAASSAITISAGTGLTGGGDLTANRTLSIANTTVTAASYGSASSVGTFTVNAQGQLTAAASTPIAIANTQVSGLGTMSTQNSNSVTITGGSITGITDLAIADGGTGASDAPTARTNLGLGTSATLNAGVALGVATLDAGGTVPLSQLPASIQGGVSYQGSWNAATNTPTITSGVGSKGYYYVVSVAGSTNIDGITDWLPGDWIIFNGTVWQKIDNTDAVASVNGYTGVVVLSAADVGAPPTSRTISAGTGLTGGGDLSTNRTLSIANTTVAAGSYGSASSVGTFTVNGQGQLTAAASTPIAITNTQVSGLGTMSTQNANAVAITGGSIDGVTIGGSTTGAGSFTTLTTSSTVTLNGGTANGVAYLNGSKVLTSGSALTFDGTNLGLGGAPNTYSGYTNLTINNAVNGPIFDLNYAGTRQATFLALTNEARIGSIANIPFTFYQNGSEQMRLTSTGLGIGTSSPGTLLHGSSGRSILTWNSTTTNNDAMIALTNSTDSSRAEILANKDGTGGATYLALGTRNTSGSTIERMRLDSSGNLTLASPGTFTYSSGTANGVAYLNGSKVLTTGSALTFDGTTLTLTGNGSFKSDFSGNGLIVSKTNVGPVNAIRSVGNTSDVLLINDSASGFTNTAFYSAGSEAMLLTSTGLGIGTSSPGAKLEVNGTALAKATSGWSVFKTSSTASDRSSVYVSSPTGTVTSSNPEWLIGHRFSAQGPLSIWKFDGSSHEASYLTLSADGNLGLGVTPSAWTSYKALQISTGTSLASTANQMVLGSNWYFNGADRYVISDFSTLYIQNSGQHKFFTAPSGTAGNAISFTQAMTLDASGNRQLGGTTTRSLSGYTFDSIIGNISGAYTDYYTGTTRRGSIGCEAGQLGISTNGALPITFDTNATERARITSGGYFKASDTGTYDGSTGSYHELRNSASGNYAAIVTSTTSSTPYGINIGYRSASPNGTGSQFLYCEDNAAQRASIRSNGGLANYSANDVNLSDRREKTNFAPAKSYLDTICAIPVQTFNYIDQSEDDPGLTLGVVAQDVQAVAPELVMESNWGTKDDPKMRLSIYQTDLQYALMKCIQELKSELDTVKAELATLKGN